MKTRIADLKQRIGFKLNERDRRSLKDKRSGNNVRRKPKGQRTTKPR